MMAAVVSSTVMGIPAGIVKKNRAPYGAPFCIKYADYY